MPKGVIAADESTVKARPSEPKGADNDSATPGRTSHSSYPTTKFPESLRVAEDPQAFSIIDAYDLGEVMYWILRCKADFPEGKQITHSPVQSLVFYQWFEKWFSQFMEKEA